MTVTTDPWAGLPVTAQPYVPVAASVTASADRTRLALGLTGTSVYLLDSYTGCRIAEILGDGPADLLLLLRDAVRVVEPLVSHAELVAEQQRRALLDDALYCPTCARVVVGDRRPTATGGWLCVRCDTLLTALDGG